MLIKPASAAEALAALEASAPDGVRGRDHARRRAGLKGEAQSAYLIDFHFASSPNWAVLHDLRIEHGTRTAQIDHLLINRWMEFFVLETKHFNAGIKIEEDGEFLRWDPYLKAYQGMASPLQQNERHIAVLSDAVGGITLPSRLGLRIAPTFNSLVLVAPAARIKRPKRFDTSKVLKADELRARIDRDIDNQNPVALLFKTAAKLVAPETVEFVARQLAALHTPVRRPANVASTPAAIDVSTSAPAARSAPGTASAPAKREPAAPAPVTASAASAPTQASPDRELIEPTFGATAAQQPPAAVDGPVCKKCQQQAGSILYGKYGYYFKCAACDTNTALRTTCQPGHAPRVRKQGLTFYRDCPECGTQVVYHRNAAEAST